jgi:sugar O-acyltransferase (sialic acid O-acetyltransferase NeuD family)
MSKSIVIFGAGQIAELAYFYWTEDAKRSVVAFTVDGAFCTGNTFLGVPVVPFEDVEKLFPPSAFDMFVAVSYRGINRFRAEKCAAARAKGYLLPSYLSTRATFLTKYPLGDNCFILENNTIQPFVRIGSNVTLWSGNHIGHHSTIEDDVFIASHVVISGGVAVGQGTFIGVNATLRDHIKVGRHCVIGAGAVVMEDTSDDALYSASRTPRALIPASNLRAI